MKSKRIKNWVALLDAQHCNSTIVAKIELPYIEKSGDYVNYNAEVALSDCNRWVNWLMVGDNGYDIDKLNNAIDVLLKLRAEMVKAQKDYEKLNKIVKKNMKKNKTESNGTQ